MKLKLQVNPKGMPENADLKALEKKGIIISPPISSDWWLYRVEVGQGQAIVAFPKFGLIGCGFEKEKDWNTNLPLQCTAEKIYNHIKHNKTEGPTKADCINAIKMIQDHLDIEPDPSL